MADREARAKCWEHRDGYFECLVKNGEDEKRCAKERAGFEKNCAASWVDYFIKRRQIQKRAASLLPPLPPSTEPFQAHLGAGDPDPASCILHPDLDDREERVASCNLSSPDGETTGPKRRKDKTVRRRSPPGTEECEGSRLSVASSV